MTNGKHFQQSQLAEESTTNETPKPLTSLTEDEKMMKETGWYTSENKKNIVFLKI